MLEPIIPMLKRLLRGDRVRFISPSSPADPDSVSQFVQIVESWGLKVELGKHVFDRLGFLAGTDRDRAADLNDAMRDPEIRGIFATQGGKGAYRIADKIDVAAVLRDPKPLIANHLNFKGRTEAAFINQTAATEGARLRIVSTVVSGFFRDMDRRLEEMKLNILEGIGSEQFCRHVRV